VRPRDFGGDRDRRPLAGSPGKARPASRSPTGELADQREDGLGFLDVG
jgi:hypothetical protein